jgi:hypothetical protein
VILLLESVPSCVLVTCPVVTFALVCLGVPWCALVCLGFVVTVLNPLVMVCRYGDVTSETSVGRLTIFIVLAFLFTTLPKMTERLRNVRSYYLSVPATQYSLYYLSEPQV